jgi:hypothetical protein
LMGLDTAEVANESELALGVRGPFAHARGCELEGIEFER